MGEKLEKAVEKGIAIRQVDANGVVTLLSNVTVYYIVDFSSAAKPYNGHYYRDKVSIHRRETEYSILCRRFAYPSSAGKKI